MGTTSLTVDVLVYALALLVGVPVLTFVHELGHGLVAALLIGGRVTIQQGPDPRFRVTLWRLDLHLRGPVAPHRGWIGWALWGAHSARWRHALATVGGPASSAGSSLACLYGARETGGAWHVFLVLLSVSAAGQLLSSSVPVRYGRRCGVFAGQASDGLRLCRLIEGRPEPAPLPRVAPLTTETLSSI